MRNNIIPEILGLRGWSRRRTPACLQSKLYNSQVQFLQKDKVLVFDGILFRVEKSSGRLKITLKRDETYKNRTLWSLILLSNSFLKGSGIRAIGIARRRTVTSNVDHLSRLSAWWEGKNPSIVSRNQEDQPRSKEVKKYYTNYVKFEASFPEGIYKIILPRLATMR